VLSAGSDIALTFCEEMTPSRSPTDERIADITMWSALVVYFVVWSGVSTIVYTEAVIAGVLLSSIYVGMHIFEITKRHHCSLSADSTAAPTTLVACGRRNESSGFQPERTRRMRRASFYSPTSFS